MTCRTRTQDGRNAAERRPLSRNRLLPLALLAVVALLPYLNSLGNGFQWDDFHHIRENPAIRDPGAIPQFFTDPSTFSRNPTPMYRPLLMVTYALNHAAGGYEVAGYHLVNMALHVLAVLLLHRFLLLLVPGAGETGAAWAAAALFAVHPLNSQAVNYISSRSVLLASSLLLAALVLYTLGRARRRPLLSAVSAPVLFLALLSKSTAIVALALLPMMELLLPGERRSLRGALLRLSGPLAAAAAYLWLARSVVERSLGSPLRPLDIQLATQARVFWHYLRLAAAPFGLSVQSDIEPLNSPFSGVALISMAGVLLLVVLLVAISLRLQSRPALFFTAWPFIILAPTWIIPLNVVVNEHRFYLALAGLLGLGAAWCAAARIDLTGTRTRAAVAVLLLLLGSLTALRNRDWRDEFTLWGDAAEKCPTCPTPPINIGLAHLRRGETTAAAASFDRALALAPDHFDALSNRGVIHLRAREYARAAEHFRRALERSPRRLDAALNLTLAELGLGDASGAAARLEPFTAAYPDHYPLFHTLGRALLADDRAQQALESYQHCTVIDPRAPEGWSGSGLALVRLGRLAEGEAAFRRSVQVDPTHFEGWAWLGNALFQQGAYGEAVTAYERARAIRPDDAKLNHNLSLCYKRARGDRPGGPAPSR